MKVYHNSFYAMGSRFNVVFPYNDEELCDKIFHSIHNEVSRIESKLSYFDKKSEVFIINSLASKNKIKLDEELYNILEICFDYYELTMGAFDITMRTVLEKNEENNNNGYGINSSFREIELDRTSKTIFFYNDAVKIDFGGFGKGYALEKIKNILGNSPLDNALISFAESSILVKGNHPNGECWQVGIKDLYDHNKSVSIVNMINNSVSTSSNYYVNDAGKLQSKKNVVNPFTGKIHDEVGMVSVISNSPLKAEILSTAFLILDDEQISSVVENIENVEVIKIDYNDKKPSQRVFK